MKLILLVIVALIVVVYVGGVLMFKMSAFGSTPAGEALEKMKSSPNYRADQQIFVNRLPDVLKQMRKEAMSLETIIEWLRKGENRQPAEHLPEVKPDLAEFIKPSEDLKIIWLGLAIFFYGEAFSVTCIES